MAGRRQSMSCSGKSGRGKGRGEGRFKKTVLKKRTIEEYQFYVGTSRQAADYESTAEFLINYIKMSFNQGNDIAETLTTMIKINTDDWMPTLKSSWESDDEKVQERENRQFKLQYKAELDKAMKRRRTYNENLYKAYALLWERCAKSMQNKIQARKDYKTSIFNDPINLLQAIKEHSMNYQETRYEMSIIADSIRAVMNLKQKENENLQEYTRQFKIAKEILEFHVSGPLYIPKIVTTLNGYDAGNEEIVKQYTK